MACSRPDPSRDHQLSRRVARCRLDRDVAGDGVLVADQVGLAGLEHRQHAVFDESPMRVSVGAQVGFQ